MGRWDQRNQRWAAKQMAAGAGWRDRARATDYTFMTPAHGLVRVNIEPFGERKASFGDFLPWPVPIEALAIPLAALRLRSWLTNEELPPSHQITIRTMGNPRETTVHTEPIPRGTSGPLRMKQIVEHLERGGWLNDLPARLPREPKLVWAKPAKRLNRLRHLSKRER